MVKTWWSLSLCLWTFPRELWQHAVSPLPRPAIPLSVPKDLTPSPPHSITPTVIVPQEPHKRDRLTSEHTPISSLLKVSWPTESLIATQRKLYINKRWPAKAPRKKVKKNIHISPQLKLTEWATCFLATDAYSTGSCKFTVQFGVAGLPRTSELNRCRGRILPFITATTLNGIYALK